MLISYIKKMSGISPCLSHSFVGFTNTSIAIFRRVLSKYRSLKKPSQSPQSWCNICSPVRSRNSSTEFVGCRNSVVTMMGLVARTGRHQQRYDDDKCRLIAGCIPYRHGKEAVEVLMITSQSVENRLLFPKGGWETDESVEEAAYREAWEEAGVQGIIEENLGSWDFKSKSYQDECRPEGLCRAQMFALHVTEELDSWPEKNNRQRKWVTITEAGKLCCYDWMREALCKCVTYLSDRQAVPSTQTESDDCSVSPELPPKPSDQEKL